MYWCKVCFVRQLCVDTFHIVIVDKIVEFQAIGTVAAHFIQAFYRVGDLEIVVVIVPGVESLVQRIVCHCMQCISVYPAGIVAVDDLTHQPEFRFYIVGDGAQHMHVVKIEHICGIQTDTIHIECTDPEADHIADVVTHGGIVLIEFDEQVVTAPVVIAETVVVFIVSTKIHIAEPVAVRRTLTVCL